MLAAAGKASQSYLLRFRLVLVETRKHYRNQLLFICIAQIGICLSVVAFRLQYEPAAWVFGVLAFLAIGLIILRAFFWHAQDLPYDLDERLISGFSEQWAIATILPPVFFMTPLPAIFWDMQTDADVIAFMAVGFTAICVVFQLLMFHRIVDFFSQSDKE